MGKIKSPFGAVDTATSLSATGAQAITVDHNNMIIDGATTQATGNRTLNLTISAEVPIGSKLTLKNKTAGTETTIAGTGMTFVTFAGSAGKTSVSEYVYDGTTYKQVATPVLID